MSEIIPFLLGLLLGGAIATVIWCAVLGRVNRELSTALDELAALRKKDESRKGGGK